MSSKSLSFWVRCAIIVIAVCGLLLCAIYYPSSFSLFDIDFIPVKPTELNTAQIWIMLTFCWLTAIPCYIILAMFWKISTAIKKEQVFTTAVAKLFKLCAIILFVDLTVFFIGNLIFLFLKINDFMWFHIVLIVLSSVISVALSVLSHYIIKAAELREENEGTI